MWLHHVEMGFISQPEEPGPPAQSKAGLQLTSLEPEQGTMQEVSMQGLQTRGWWLWPPHLVAGHLRLPAS